MATFQDFLQRKASEHHHAERREKREEWISAVRRLLDDIRSWLAESDPDRLLDVISYDVERWEPGLGSYTIQALTIGVGDTAVKVVPVGRDAVGLVSAQGDAGARAEGRVDITDGVRKYILYRTFRDGQQQWHVLNADFHPVPLTRAALENVLQDLLS
jgi:hypothetical protein